MKTETNFEKINKQGIIKIKDLHFEKINEFNFIFVALNKC